MKKYIWAKISGIPENILTKEGEEVIIKRTESTGIKKKNQDKKNDGEEWLMAQKEGQLMVDICEKDNNLIIISTVAGVSPQDVDITVEPDLIVIRGQRRKKITDVQYYRQECFWGKFSRTLILPYRIMPEKVKANLKNGILTIILPKTEKNQTIKIDGSK